MTGSRGPVGRCLATVMTLAALCAAAPAGASERPCVLPVEPQSDRENIVYPDTTVTYQAGYVPILPGGHTEIHGEFPHARFMSLQTSGPNGQNVNAWADADIAPDAGAVNPFTPGADRTGEGRGYTMKMVDAPVPATGPERNTLYTSTADGRVRGIPGVGLVVLRYYLPDRGRGRSGGVPPLRVTLVGPTGERTPTPTCPDPVGDPGATQAAAATSPQGAVVLGDAVGGATARKVPVWRKFVNAAGGYAAALFDTDVAGQTLYPSTTGITQRAPAGLFENIFNTYVSTSVSTDFGPVLVLRGKLPTTPRTFEGQPRMGTGQLRYWSLCSNQTYTTMVYACLSDEDVPVDADGRFTVAVSAAAARPSNAIRACGIGWLPTGLPGPTALILRNMLPAPDFAEAIQHLEPGEEQQKMGAYYPIGEYARTVADVERLGCRAPTPATGPAPAATCPETTAKVRFRLRPPKGTRVVHATIYVDGKKTLVRRGRTITSLSLTRPRRARFAVRVVSRLSDGRVRTSRRVFSGCGRKTRPVTQTTPR